MFLLHFVWWLPDFGSSKTFSILVYIWIKGTSNWFFSIAAKRWHLQLQHFTLTILKRTPLWNSRLISFTTLFQISQSWWHFILSFFPFFSCCMMIDCLKLPILIWMSNHDIATEANMKFYNNMMLKSGHIRQFSRQAQYKSRSIAQRETLCSEGR